MMVLFIKHNRTTYPRLASSLRLSWDTLKLVTYIVPLT